MPKASPFSYPIRFFSHLIFWLETLVNERLLRKETALLLEERYEWLHKILIYSVIASLNNMTKESPLVSVIVPAYNADTFIERTLNSILTQTYINIEVLVVDDGSEDRTAEIVKSFVEKDSRVILLEQKNAGVAAARNLAIEKSSGEYIAPIDADDIWYPQKLEKQVQYMLEGDQSLGLVYAWSVRIDENDLIFGISDIEYYKNFLTVEGTVYPALLYTNFINNASAPLIRRSCFKKVGFYNCKLKAHNAQGCEDWELYLRIAEHYKFRVVREFLIGYRQVRGSMSRNYLSMERSYNLVMAEFRPRHPEIATYIYNLSTSNFYIYLLEASQECGDYWNTVVLVYKAIKLDYTQIVRLFKRHFLMKLILKIAGKPIMHFMGLEHDYWYKAFKMRNKKFSKISDINCMIKIPNKTGRTNKDQQQYVELYERIQLQKWLRILQFLKQLNEQSTQLKEK
ncbi:glycosyltransferase family 2 protein [Nostoc sp. UHCC 0251]|uniref:glycosyltransferase family 2 protein n=1 Tax=Nostoc sp. UHCC 0251 TaxID=3110240 RepID=UPI002B1EA062|nr:glycosyltransferase family 2 protein [Nostoc sp. UHCC 0251]MEA5622018.1 glycosyltransferase family 2 protein [Nostoc sp. UHCC 0251]